MDEIPVFQSVRVAKNRVVIRHYDENKDVFVKLAEAEKAYVVNNFLLVADDNNLFVSNDGKCYPLGKMSDGVQEFACGVDKLLRVNVPEFLGAALFVFVRSRRVRDCALAVSYQKKGNEVRIMTPAGEKNVMYFAAVSYCPYDGDSIEKGIL